MECRKRRVLGIRRKENSKQEPLDFGTESSCWVCSLADVGNHHGSDEKSWVSFRDGRAFYPDRNRGLNRRHTENSKFIFYSFGRRTKHDFFHNCSINDPFFGCSISVAKSGKSPVGFPDSRVFVRIRRWQFCLLNEQYQFLFSKAEAGLCVGCQRRIG